MAGKDINDDELAKVLTLVVVCFLIHMAFISFHPFYLDEALYVEMISEQQDHLTLVPTYLGYEVGWKPPFFFWAFAPLTKMISLLSNNVEFIYRMPNIMFGMANALLVYLIFRRCMKREEAYFAAAFYAFSALFIFTNERLLIDTFAMTIMLASISVYTNGAPEDWKRFPLAGILMFLAFLTKSVVAFVIPVVAVAYLLQKERNALSNPYFLVSLAAIPLALGLHYVSLPADQAQDVFLKDIAGKLDSTNSFFGKIGGSLNMALVFLNFLAVMSVPGFAYFWREDYSMSAWFVLSLFPLLGGYSMPWYFYAVLPPMAFFSAKFMQRDPQTGKMKIDHFFKAACLFMVAMNILIAYLWFGFFLDIDEERTAGEFLAGKQNAAIIGYYGPASIITAYKLMEERKKTGKIEDFGWVIIPQDKINETVMLDFMENYSTAKYKTNEENFARLFWTNEIFRKKTGSTDFEYLVASSSLQPEIECYEKIYSGKEVAIYKKVCGKC